MNSHSARWMIGIDEAGRGPLAGPVVVAGVRVELRVKKGGEVGLFRGIKDSKKLSAKKREEWFCMLTNHLQIAWAIARILPRTIDRINIAQAVNLGARRVFSSLRPPFGDVISERRVRVLLDGSLQLPNHISHEVIIKGDEKEPLIAAASIIAKVTRDRIMMRLHKKYPQYGFNRHKGYGTKLHRDMVCQYGACVLHRRSFLQNVNRICSMDDM